MTTPFARCLECNSTFSRREAADGAGNEFACPNCGSGMVRGVPQEHTARTERDTTRCGACGATFPRSASVTDVKGELACPECGEERALEPIDR